MSSVYKDTIAGRPVQGSVNPTTGQVYVWDDVDGRWEPGSVSSYGSVTIEDGTQRVSFWDWFEVLWEIGSSVSTGYEQAGSTGENAFATGDATTGKRYVRTSNSTVTGDRSGLRTAVTNPRLIRSAENPNFKILVLLGVAPVGGTQDAYCGLRLNETTGLQDGIYFRATDAGNWFLVCRNSGVESTVDMSVAPSSTLKLLEFKITSDGASVQGYVNGVSTGAAITTNIPTALLIPMFFVDNRAATVTTAFEIRAYGWGWETDLIA